METSTVHGMKKPYTLAIFAALNGDGSYRYTSQIWPEYGDRQGSRAVNMTFKDEICFRNQVNATLASGEDLAQFMAKLQKGKRFTWKHRMLADDQAAVFGWIS